LTVASLMNSSAAACRLVAPLATTLSGPGRPSKVFTASRDANAAWAGRYVSPEAATDQNTAVIAVTSDLTTLILRSSLKLYTRTFD
jgi:hypothetical protein